MTLGTVRHHVRIARPANEVWARVGDAAALHTWFPGITDCHVEGTSRTITLGTGMQMPEEIITHDHLLRRFQYRIATPIFQFHRGTIDVLDMGDGTSVVVYTTEADPRTMALAIGGGTAGALDELKRQLEPNEGAA
ncbi:MAG: SRPBCC family protein [Acidimicrobiaceae bacterium]|nr:SRPBCC family protein [Ilumatobacter sp.]MCB9381759.1 SRPBCC family protein [Acidimicrobiaceae bacterium]MCO5329655.1 SRPBCC family protein [Ilumatobacteraceae bacterium]